MSILPSKVASTALIAIAMLSAGTVSLRAADIVADFTCDDAKTIKATFKTGSVDLVLSDGRTLSLPQAQSADGGRYADADEKTVFWNVGNTAFITENGDPNVETYKNCATKSS